jgi:threonine/homoserine/homoserine lactone efflux protein
MTLVWLVAVATAAGRLRAVLQRDPVRRAIEAVTGTVLIGLGVRVAVEGRV